MDRRRFVAGVGAALPFAGCSGFRSDRRSPSPSPTEEGETRYELEAYSIGIDGLRVGAVARPGDLPEDAFDAFRAALDGEKARTYGRSFFEHLRLVAYRGLFYRVTVEETGRKTRERPVLRAEVVDSEAAERTAADWSAYAGDDGTAVRRAASNAVERSDDSVEAGTDGTTGDGPDRGLRVLRGRDPEVSDLLPEPEHEYVEYDGAVLRLAVERRQVTETEYTYATERIADSASELRAFLREEVVDVWLDGSDLPARQRTIFEAARDDGYAETGDLTDPYHALLERVFGSPLPADTTGERLGYDGRIHKVHLHVEGQ